MHHLAHRMTKLCEGREQDNVGWEGVPVYDSSGGGGKLPFIVVCRGGDLHLLFPGLIIHRIPIAYPLS